MRKKKHSLCLSEPGFGGIFEIYMINSQFI